MRNLIYPSLCLLASCASPQDVAIVAQHYKALNSHNTEQTKQVTTKAQYIQELMDFECSDTDMGSEACGAMRAMAKMVASERISEIKPQEFKEKKPKTSLWVQYKLLDTLQTGIVPISSAIVTSRAIDNTKENTTQELNNTGTINIDQDSASNSGTGSVQNTPQEDNSTSTEEHQTTTGE